MWNSLYSDRGGSIKLDGDTRLVQVRRQHFDDSLLLVSCANSHVKVHQSWTLHRFISPHRADPLVTAIPIRMKSSWNFAVLNLGFWRPLEWYTCTSKLNLCVHDTEGGSNPSLQAKRWPLQAQPSPQRLFPRKSIPQWQATPTRTQAPPTWTEPSSPLQTPLPQQKGDYILT